MLKKTKLHVSATALAVAALALVTVSAGPALADPAPGFTGSLAGVGSDTIQDVLNGIVHDYPNDIASYDAVDPVSGLAYGATTTTTTSPNVTIQTKSGGPTFARPNGSGQGITALSDSINGNPWNGQTITGQIDFARSSSGPSGNGTALTFLPFAQDAVTYAVNQASDFPRSLAFDPQNNGVRVSTTTLTLYNIYHCTRTTYTDSNLNPVTIRPLLPQSGSGTRKFWESKLGLNDSALPSCVKDVTSTGGKVEEHNGNALLGAGDIMPFSIAQYISQGNHAALLTSEGVNVVERKGQAALGSIDGNSPYQISGTSVIMNPSFPINRLVYNVVATSRLNEAGISSVFVGNSSKVCSDTSTIASFGFSTIGSACGVSTGTQALG